MFLSLFYPAAVWVCCPGLDIDQRMSETCHTLLRLLSILAYTDIRKRKKCNEFYLEVLSLKLEGRNAWFSEVFALYAGNPRLTSKPSAMYLLSSSTQEKHIAIRS